MIDLLKYITLESISGKFYVDERGILHHFEPSIDNDYIIEETECEYNYFFRTHRSIRTFIVPEGVKGFASEVMRYTRVVERFELPDGLLFIGNTSEQEYDSSCVFADCILPSVTIPDSVKEIGVYAFGGTHIDTLQLPSSLRSPYLRQFKDSHIGTLVIPSEWKDFVTIHEHRYTFNGLMPVLFDEYWGFLRWHSTAIDTVIFN